MDSSSASSPRDITPEMARQLPTHSVELLGFRNYILLELCWLHYEDYLVSTHGPDRRQASAKLCGLKRVQHAQPAIQALATIRDRMASDQADCLQTEFQFLQGRNDIAWILSTGNQFCPSRHLVLQCLCRLVYRTLFANMESRLMAQTLARVIHDRALPLWCHSTLVALLPLVPRKDMGRLQAWYADYEFQARARHAILYGLQAPATGSSSNPPHAEEPPSGSRLLYRSIRAKLNDGGDSVPRHWGGNTPFLDAVVFNEAGAINLVPWCCSSSPTSFSLEFGFS
eukprot:s8110_g1.t1